MVDINSFEQTAVQGQLDLQADGNSLSAQVDTGETGTLVAGEAAKIVDNAGGVPKVEKLAADTDSTFGFVTRNVRDADYEAGDTLELARTGAIIYLTAGAAIARGADVEVDASAVKVIPAAGTNPVVGQAIDKASADGDLVRVELTLN